MVASGKWVLVITTWRAFSWAEILPQLVVAYVGRSRTCVFVTGTGALFVRYCFRGRVWVFFSAGVAKLFLNLLAVRLNGRERETERKKLDEIGKKHYDQLDFTGSTKRYEEEERKTHTHTNAYINRTKCYTQSCFQKHILSIQQIT